MTLKLPRPPSLTDNANVVLFLASEEARYMTGLAIPTCDGGLASKIGMTFEPNWSESLVPDNVR